MDAINHYTYNYYWRTCSASSEISQRILGGCEGPRADPINISSSIIPGVDVVYLGAESWRNSGETSVEESSFSSQVDVECEEFCCE